MNNRILVLALSIALAVSTNVFVATPRAAATTPQPIHDDSGASGTWIVTERAESDSRSGSTRATKLERVWVDNGATFSSHALSALRFAVEQNFVEMGTPNDPRFDDQWNFSGIGTESAWNHSTGGGVVVAVLDSGLGTGGSDTPCNGITFPYNAITETEGVAAVVDRSGHGTHVSGTIAQCTNNGVGVAGVAHSAAVMPIKVLDSIEGGGTTIEIVRGIEWAIDHGADVINISLGSRDCGGTEDAIISPRIQEAIDLGIVVVASAGNNTGSPYCLRYPASDASTIAVGASTIAETVATYSERGSGLTLVAPGGDSGSAKVLQETVDGTTYAIEGWIGTSMAAPHVAGVAALIKSLDPSLDQSAISSILTSTATDIGPAGWDEDSGAGILDAGKAIDAVTAEPPMPVTIVGGVAAVSANHAAEISAAHHVSIERLAGSNRYETAAAISTATYPAGAAHAYIVTGQSFADALGVGPIAHMNSGPVLLTSQTSLPSATLSELKRLSPSAITIVGGEAVISKAVATALKSLAPTTRIAGANRYATAAELSSQNLASATKVYLVNGEAFPDGLAGGPLAAIDNAPILLTRSSELPLETRNEIARLGATTAVIIGGTAVVSSSVADALGEVVPFVERIAGANRYATAAAVAKHFSEPRGVTIASGLTFPDALTAAPMAAASASPILLVGSGSVPTATLSAIGQIAR